MDNRARRKAVLACVAGNAFEGFDFILFGMLSAIMAKLYFPTFDGNSSLMLTLATFGVGFVIRPLGGIVWGLYADRVGRQPALAKLSITMGFGTALIAIAPTYAVIGPAAAVIVVLARLIQGFSVGGVAASSASMLSEVAGPGRKGLFTSLQMVTQPLTIAVGALSVLALTHGLGPEAFEAWGWRLLFLIGALIGPLGLYIRRSVEETPEFVAEKSSRRGHEARVSDIFDYKIELLLAAGVLLVGTAAFYLTMIYLPIFAVRQLGLTNSEAQTSILIAVVLQAVACVWAGSMSDRLGRRTVLLPAALLWTLLAYPVFALIIGAPSLTHLILAQTVLAVLVGLISGPTPSCLTEMFPVQIRSTAIGIVANTVIAIFGGLGPLIITWIVTVTGDPAGPAYWAMGTGMVGVVAIFSLRFATGVSQLKVRNESDLFGLKL